MGAVVVVVLLILLPQQKSRAKPSLRALALHTSAPGKVTTSARPIRTCVARAGTRVFQRPRPHRRMLCTRAWAAAPTRVRRWSSLLVVSRVRRGGAASNAFLCAGTPTRLCPGSGRPPRRLQNGDPHIYINSIKTGFLSQKKFASKIRITAVSGHLGPSCSAIINNKWSSSFSAAGVTLPSN